MTSRRPASVPLPSREYELRAPLERFLSSRGYRVDFDVDGRDYFDAVARRENELGLVELKLTDWRKVHAQALVRRAWGDWVAVLLPRHSLAERLLGRKGPPAVGRVGLWYLERGEVQVLREAERIPGAGSSTLRGELQFALGVRDRGELPPGAVWAGLGPVSHRRGRRRWDGRFWRLEEFAEPPPEEPPSAGREPPGGQP